MMGDLLVLDLASESGRWAPLDPDTVRGTPPSPRRAHGMAAAGGLLYVYGGSGPNNGGMSPVCARVPRPDARVCVHGHACVRMCVHSHCSEELMRKQA